MLNGIIVVEVPQPYHTKAIGFHIPNGCYTWCSRPRYPPAHRHCGQTHGKGPQEFPPTRAPMGGAWDVTWMLTYMRTLALSTLVRRLKCGCSETAKPFSNDIWYFKRNRNTKCQMLAQNVKRIKMWLIIHFKMAQWPCGKYNNCNVKHNCQVTVRFVRVRWRMKIYRIDWFCVADAMLSSTARRCVGKRQVWWWLPAEVAKWPARISRYIKKKSDTIAESSVRYALTR